MVQYCSNFDIIFRHHFDPPFFARVDHRRLPQRHAAGRIPLLDVPCWLVYVQLCCVQIGAHLRPATGTFSSDRIGRVRSRTPRHP